MPRLKPDQEADFNELVTVCMDASENVQKGSVGCRSGIRTPTCTRPELQASCQDWPQLPVLGAWAPNTHKHPQLDVYLQAEPVSKVQDHRVLCSLSREAKE